MITMNIYEKQQYWNQFKVFRNGVVNTLKIKKRMYYENKIDSNKNNPKAMWKTLKTLIKKENHNFINNTTLFEIDDRIVSFNEDADLAENFNKNFIGSIGEIINSINNTTEWTDAELINIDNNFSNFKILTINELQKIVSDLCNKTNT
ncbi:hypothetical protein NQ314_005716 [Rhamnusium bicolor]|uniref:Uncharacterized protein n=1 Tax=Rhamnusium bicolor TaxID=1586634 RepID=A0AAV8ZDE9_9CUCU|nr:hypothetical protein NQ314_005716 [Rhamnusium bicolor]